MRNLSEMKHLLEVVRPSGEVLQIGFHKTTASAVRSYHPNHHWILEHKPEALLEAQNWAKEHSEVTVLGELWQEALPRLGVFDAIFLDEMPSKGKKEQTDDVNMVVQGGKEFLQSIAEQFPGLSSIRYSDRDLEEFCAVAASRPEALARFIYELKQNGQITQEQYESMLHKHHLKKDERESAIFKAVKYHDLFFELVFSCIQNHMRKGGRLACFLRDGLSRYEDPQFFEHIITNPALNYQELEVQNAVLMLIERLS